MINLSPATVIIADDQTLFADGLEHIINHTEGFKVIAKVGNGKLLMQCLNRLEPDLILLDIHMPFMGGLESALAIRKKFKSIRIILISMHYERNYKSFIKEHDLNGYMIKNVSAEQLRDGLDKVMANQKIFIPPAGLNERIPFSPENKLLEEFKLTKTETEIIQLIAEGLSTKMIAAKRSLSILTIESHRKNIFRKLDAKNMADVVAFAVLQGIYQKQDG